jgi:sugar/nucleoside kinase (ribokinase family)
MFDVVTVGSATEDVFVYVRRTVVIGIQAPRKEEAYLGMPHGAKVPVDNIHIMTGGGATNVGVGLSRMGLKVACLAKVGCDEPGDRVVAELQKEGVDTSLIARSDAHHTGYSVIITAFTGERTILAHRGAAEQLRMEDTDAEKLAQAKWIHLGALKGVSAQTFFQLADFAAQRGIKLSANPGESQLKLGMDGLAPALAKMELVMVNLDEAYELTGVAPDPGKADEQKMLQKLHEAGAKRAVITCGDAGADGYDGESFYSVPAYKVKVAATVGAGDAFGTGCLAALYRGLGLAEAMKIGAANAAAVVQHVGAKTGLLSWEEAQSFVASRPPGE